MSAALMMMVFLPMASRYRYRKIVKCPDSAEPAEILIDAFPTSSPPVRKKRVAIRSCGLWPQKKACTQSCLR